MKRKTATLYLPKNGKEAWTGIMEGNLPEMATDVLDGQPIVMSVATFKDGFRVAGGVYKSPEPEVYNIKFLNVFTPDGQQIPFLLDPSDHEDFRHSSYVFYWREEETEDQYVVHVKERKKEWQFQP